MKEYVRHNARYRGPKESKKINSFAIDVENSIKSLRKDVGNLTVRFKEVSALKGNESSIQKLYTKLERVQRRIDNK